LELLGFAEEFDDFLDVFLRFVATGDVLEGRAFLVLAEQLGAALGEGHGALVGVFQQAVDEEDDESSDDERRKELEEDDFQVGVRLGEGDRIRNLLLNLLD
jgi:hypothetical protein